MGCYELSCQDFDAWSTRPPVSRKARCWPSSKATSDILNYEGGYVQDSPTTPMRCGGSSTGSSWRRTWEGRHDHPSKARLPRSKKTGPTYKPGEKQRLTPQLR